MAMTPEQKLRQICEAIAKTIPVQIDQYEKSKGYDLTDEDDKEATDGKTAPPPKG